MAKSLENPKVSVIIPTYNRADLLPRAIESVLNQTFKDFELIVVDDGSTDNTKELVSDFQKKDNRIQYIWQENSGAPAKPKNTGIKNSKGDYIAILDSDDEWLPEKLEKQLKLFEKDKNLGIVGCNCYDVYATQMNKKKERKIKVSRNKENQFSEILGRCFIRSSSSIVIPKFVFDSVGLYDERFKIADDWDLYLRVIPKYKFDFIDEPLFNYYIHNNNISRSSHKSNFIQETLAILEKHGGLYENNNSAKSNLFGYIGMAYFVMDNREKSIEYFFNALNISFFNTRNYINLFFYFIGLNNYKKIKKLKIF